jgi:hypothetical protein
MYRHYDAPKPSEGIRDKRKEDATDRHFLNFAPSRENVTEAPRKVTPKLHHQIGKGDLRTNCWDQGVLYFQLGATVQSGWNKILNACVQTRYMNIDSSNLERLPLNEQPGQYTKPIARRHARRNIVLPQIKQRGI